jgi:hypothetical protein
MPDTLSNLRDKLESNHAKLIDKIEKDTGELKNIIDANVTKFENNHTKVMDKLEIDTKALNAAISKNVTKVASIDATIKTAKLITFSTGLIAALIGVVAAMISVFVMNEFNKQRTGLDDLLHSNALLTQVQLTDRLEALFNNEGSLDSLGDQKNSNIRDEIKTITTEFKRIAKHLAESERSTFFLVGEAIEPYLANNCQSVLHC